MTQESTSGAQSPNPTLAQQVRTMQIITLAMVMGVCAFGMVAIGQSGNQVAPAAQPAAPVLGTMSFMAVGLLVICGTIAAVLPRVIVKAQLKNIAKSSAHGESSAGEDRAGKFLSALLSTYQVQHIIRAALFEGPAFFGLLAYMQERHPAVLVVPAVSIGILLTSFPTVRKVGGWVEERLAELLASGGRE